MTGSLIVALLFTGALLIVTAYFIMGSIPLLTLTHDTPLDASFVRSFFNLYYVAAFVTASATAVSCAVAGRPALATGAAMLALLAVGLRRKIIPAMDALGAQIQSGGMQSGDMQAIQAFRKTHMAAIAINIVQLVVIVWSLIAAQL